MTVRFEAITRHSGFTLVEVAVVIILLAIVAVFIAPRVNVNRFDELGFFEETLAAVRYAHKIAITSGCPVQVAVTPGVGGGVALRYAGGDCGTADVVNPIDPASQFATNAPGGVSFAGTSFTYGITGDPSGGGDITLTVTNADSSTRSIRIVDVTGFAFQP